MEGHWRLDGASAEGRIDRPVALGIIRANLCYLPLSFRPDRLGYARLTRHNLSWKSDRGHAELDREPQGFEAGLRKHPYLVEGQAPRCSGRNLWCAFIRSFQMTSRAGWRAVVNCWRAFGARFPPFRIGRVVPG